MEKLKFILLAFLWMSLLLPAQEAFAQELLEAGVEVPVSDPDSNELSEEESSEDEEESSLACLRACFPFKEELYSPVYLIKPSYRLDLTCRIDSPPRQ